MDLDPEELLPKRDFVPLIEQINQLADSEPKLLDMPKSKEQLRVESLRQQIQKRTNDKWKKALKHLNINENLFNRREELFEMEPFKSFNIARVEAGEFQTK